MENNNEVNNTVQPTTVDMSQIQPQPTAAPQAPAAEKKSNVGLIVAIGCGGLFVLGIIIAIIIILIVALGGNKLTCTKDYEDEDTKCKESTSYIWKFNKENHIVSATMSGTYDCTNYSDGEAYVKELESDLKKYTGYKEGMTIDTKVHGKKLKYTISAKNTEEETKNSRTKDQLKSDYEKSGYKCK